MNLGYLPLFFLAMCVLVNNPKIKDVFMAIKYCLYKVVLFLLFLPDTNFRLSIYTSSIIFDMHSFLTLVLFIFSTLFSLQVYADDDNLDYYDNPMYFGFSSLANGKKLTHCDRYTTLAGLFLGPGNDDSKVHVGKYI